MSTKYRILARFAHMRFNGCMTREKTPAPARTRVDEVRRLLRADILNGRIPAGARLPFAELASRYQVSSGVMREVLPRLVGEGLAVSEPQLGFRVVSVSTADLIHLTETRVLIETMTLRRSINEGDLAWESRLLASHHTLASIPVTDAASGEVLLEWLDAHAAFHRTLLDGCANVRLRDVASALRDSGEIYRCSAKGAEREAGRDVPAEHRRILDAALARNADAAVLELAAHIELSARLLLDRMADDEASGGKVPRS